LDNASIVQAFKFDRSSSNNNEELYNVPKITDSTLDCQFIPYPQNVPSLTGTN
jgi:hypothetical protein